MNQNGKQTYDSEKYILVYFPNHLLLYSLSYMSWYGVHTMHDSRLSLLMTGVAGQGFGKGLVFTKEDVELGVVEPLM
jgi:hypothetical protein